MSDLTATASLCSDCLDGTHAACPGGPDLDPTRCCCLAPTAAAGAALSEQERRVVDLITAMRWEEIARDLRALAARADVEATRVGQGNRTRTTEAIVFVKAVHDAIPNLGLTALISEAADADAAEASILAGRAAGTMPTVTVESEASTDEQ
jgi:transcriptional accessory protein Tex/SPT6